MEISETDLFDTLTIQNDQISYVMGAYGSPLASMGTFGDPLAPMGTSGGLWAPMGAYGDLLAPMGTYGGLWGPLGTHWHLWGPMGTYRGLWGGGHQLFAHPFGHQPPPPFPPSIKSISDISHILLYTVQQQHATSDIRLYTQSCHGPIRTLFLGLILCLVPMTPCETMLYWPSPN